MQQASMHQEDPVQVRRTMGSSWKRAAAGDAPSRARLALSTWLSPAGRLPITAGVMKLERRLLGWGGQEVG